MKNYTMHSTLTGFVTFIVSSNRICKTLEICLPARIPEFFHSFRGGEGDFVSLILVYPILLQQLQDPHSFSPLKLEEMKNPFPFGILT
jgi:hypothetical protein